MTQYHEPVQELAPQDRDIVRALASLREEVEAVDWYHQRQATTADEGLREILAHNRDEEIEHACMMLEYLRRLSPAWDRELRTYLFTSAPIAHIEEGGGEEEGGEERQAPAQPAGSLGIGSLKGNPSHRKEE